MDLVRELPVDPDQVLIDQSGAVRRGAWRARCRERPVIYQVVAFAAVQPSPFSSIDQPHPDGVSLSLSLSLSLSQL